jgi:hypothetical protein
VSIFTPEGIERSLETIGRLRNKLHRLVDDDATATSPLAVIPRAQRKTYEKVFELIYKCSTNQIAAKALIDRILQTI